MVIHADAIDGRLDPRVQQLDDQYRHDAADQQRSLDGVPTEPETYRARDDGERAFLPKRSLVDPSSAQSGERDTVARADPEGLE